MAATQAADHDTAAGHLPGVGWDIQRQVLPQKQLLRAIYGVMRMLVPQKHIMKIFCLHGTLVQKLIPGRSGALLMEAGPDCPPSRDVPAAQCRQVPSTAASAASDGEAEPCPCPHWFPCQAEEAKSNEAAPGTSVQQQQLRPELLLLC